MRGANSQNEDVVFMREEPICRRTVIDRKNIQLAKPRSAQDTIKKIRFSAVAVVNTLYMCLPPSWPRRPQIHKHESQAVRKSVNAGSLQLHSAMAWREHPPMTARDDRENQVECPISCGLVGIHPATTKALGFVT